MNPKMAPLVLSPILLLFSATLLLGFIPVFDNAEIRQTTLQFIRDTRYSLDVCVYGINDPQVIQAFQECVDRGVQVRIVTENLNAFEVYAIKGAQVVVDRSDGLMHTKYMISDHLRVWCGSANLTHTSLDAHANHVIILECPKQVGRFLQHFEQSVNGLFKFDRIASYPRYGVYFSPEDNPFELIMSHLAQASKEVLIGAYAFTDYRIAHFLMILSSKGIRVHTLADPSWNLSSPYSVVQKVSPFSPVTLADVEEGLFHDKFMMIDQRVVLFGSYNFTESASFRNDEVLLISTDPHVVNAFSRQFDSFQPSIGGAP